MEKYEKTIGLKTIWTTIIKRWYIFLMIFAPIGLISFIVTNTFLAKSYISYITLSRGSLIGASYYSVVQSYVQGTSDDEKKPGAIYTTAQKLKEDGFFHTNGSEITVNEILSGISFSPLESNSTTITFSFQSNDSSIVQRVLNELAKESVANIKAYAGSDYASLSISGVASPTTKNSKENTYFLIALAAGFVVAFGIPFVDEIVSDEVYDKYDIESLGCSAFEVKAKPKKKEA